MDKTPSSCAAVMAVLLAAGAAAAQDEPTIRFGDDLGAALRDAARRKVVVVAYFSAKWCGWCRKMQLSTFGDRAVAALGGRFAWVKIDTGDQPELAASYQVTALPCVLLLNAEGRVLARQDGFTPPGMLAALLRQWMDKGAAPEAGKETDAVDKLVADLRKAGADLAGADGRAGPELTAAVERLASPDRGGRQRICEALAKAGKPAQAPLLGLMADKRLAVRAAAGEALAHVAGPGGPAFDPFADAGDRARQIAAWRDWLAGRRAAPTTRPAAAPAAPPPGKAAK